MTTTQQKISIIGGGPGGLMLALLLQQHGMKATIYERAPHDLTQSLGGSLDIHEDTGQQALKAAGVFDAFLEKARFEGEDFRLVDKHLNVYLDETATADQPGARPEIDRGELCGLLLQKLDSTTIQYGYRLESCHTLENGQTALRFDNGETIISDLVIGSDGAFSRVRSLLSTTDVTYSGLTMLELTIPDVAATHPDLAALNKRGKLFALDDHKGLIGQLNGDGSLKVYVSMRVAQDWLETCNIAFHDMEAAKKALLQHFEDWHDTLKNYIRYAAGGITPRRIYMLPIGFTWTANKNVTLIGDAAHVMSPFAGEGVNMALFDAFTLAMALINKPDTALADYEKMMFAYSSKSAKDSNDNLTLCFSEHAAEKLAALMHSFHEG